MATILSNDMKLSGTGVLWAANFAQNGGLNVTVLNIGVATVLIETSTDNSSWTIVQTLTAKGKTFVDASDYVRVRVSAWTSGQVEVDCEESAVSSTSLNRPSSATPAISGFPGIVPSRHLAKVAAASSPVVVTLGDSIGTMADAIAYSEHSSNMFFRALQQANPAKTFAFYERCIGSASWVHLDGIKPASQSPSWYTTPANSWLSYIQPLAPDLIIFHMGQNSNATQAEIDAMYSVVAKIKAWAKVPDMIFVTPYRPANDTTELRDQTAGYIRGYALSNGYGLVDVGRFSNIVRNGYDPLRENLKQVKQSFAPGSTPWSFQDASGVSCNTRDFAFYFQCTSTSTLFASNRKLCVQIGGLPDNALEIDKDAGGNYAFAIKATGTTYAVTRAISAIAVPSAAWFEVIVRGNYVWVGVAGAASSPGTFTKLYEGFVPRFGGLFTPSVFLTNGSASTGTLFINRVQVSEPRANAPVLSEVEMFGAVGDTSFNSTYGGNAINHPTSIGLTRVYAPMIEAQVWAA